MGGLLFFILPALQWAIPKKSEDVVGDILTFLVLGKPPKISRYVTLPLAIRDKTRFHSWNFCKVVLAIPLENPRTKNQGHWKFQIFFLSPLEILHLFKLTFGNSAFYFFVTPRNSMPSSRPVCYFLGIAQS